MKTFFLMVYFRMLHYLVCKNRPSVRIASIGFVVKKALYKQKVTIDAMDGISGVAAFVFA